MHVVIVGAGAAGLATARFFSDSNLSRPAPLVTVLEAAETVGGTWARSRATTATSRLDAVCGRVYASLRTNLPHRLMQFSDAPFPEGTAEFPDHSVVAEYLRAYSVKHDLLPLVQLATVLVQADYSGDGWSLEVQHWPTRATRMVRCNVLILATGHYAVPSLPPPALFAGYSGHVVHSHEYWAPDAEPERFVQKRILVIGGGNSGVDIARDLAQTKWRNCIILSVRAGGPPIKAPLDRIQLVGEVAGAKERSVALCDGGHLEDIDTVLLATGYRYEFPFLNKVLQRAIVPDPPATDVGGALQRFLVCEAQPRLALVGLPTRVVPFPLFEYQAQWLVWFYTVNGGALSNLSPASDFWALARNENTGRRVDFRKFEFDYCDALANEAGLLPPVPLWRRQLRTEVSALRDLYLFNRV